MLIKVKNPLIIISLTLTTAMLSIFISDMYIPSLPEISRYFSTSPSLVQLTVTIYMFGYAVSQLIYGPLSDYFGRRRCLLSGLIICTIGSLICWQAHSIYTLLIGRFVQSIGAGASGFMHRSIIRDLYSGKKYAQIASIAGVFFSIAPAVAPIAGGYLEQYYGWRSNFVVILGIMAAVMLIIYTLMPETNQHIKTVAIKIKTIARNYRRVLTCPTFVGYTIAGSTTLAGIIAYVTASPFLFQNILGLTPVAYGWLAIYLVLSSIPGKIINAFALSKFSVNNLIIFGIITMIISGLIMLGFGLLGIMNIPVIIIPMMLYLFCGGFVFSNAISGALQFFPKIAGTAAAVYGFLQISCCFVTSGTVALLHEHNQVPLAIIFVALGAITLPLFYATVIRNNRVAKNNR